MILVQGVALAFGLLLATAVAFLALRWIDPETRCPRLVGEALILGSALPAVALFLFSLAGVPWSRGALVGSGLIVLVPLLWGVRKRTLPERQRERWWVSGADLAVSVLIALLVVALLAGYAQFALVSAGAENDFIGIWGAKGRVFLEAGRIDWDFLAAPWRGYAHPDYPLLVPLMFSATGLLVGAWSEPALSVVYPMLSLGALILAWAEFGMRSRRAAMRMVGVLVVLPFVASPWIGLADGPLAVMALAALSRLSHWLDEGRPRDLTVGAVFLGLAMSAKNEGVALAFVAALVMLVAAPKVRRVKVVPGLWPAAMIGLPWLALRSVHRLSTDLFEGGAVVRLAARLTDAEYLAALGRHLVEFRPGTWEVYLLFLAAFVIGWGRSSIGARFVALVALAQLCVDVGAYLVTPLPLEWHVRWSWERLVSQVGAAFSVFAVSILLGLAESGSGVRRLSAFFGAGPEIQDQQADPDADR